VLGGSARAGLSVTMEIGLICCRLILLRGAVRSDHEHREDKRSCTNGKGWKLVAEEDA